MAALVGAGKREMGPCSGPFLLISETPTPPFRNVAFQLEFSIFRTTPLEMVLLGPGVLHIPEGRPHEGKDGCAAVGVAFLSVLRSPARSPVLWFRFLHPGGNLERPDAELVRVSRMRASFNVNSNDQ